MKKRSKAGNLPLLRVRPMLAGIVLVLMMISGPLLLVWKQVYINTASLRMESMRKSLAILHKEITTLKLSSTRLSSADRIETIAREKLDLEYPSTSQIYVVHVKPKSHDAFFSKPVDFVAFLRKMISGERS